MSPKAHLSNGRRSNCGSYRSMLGIPTKGLEDQSCMSGGLPGGCHRSAGGGGALDAILVERLGSGWSGRVESVNTLRGELG